MGRRRRAGLFVPCYCWIVPEILDVTASFSRRAARISCIILTPLESSRSYRFRIDSFPTRGHLAGCTTNPKNPVTRVPPVPKFLLD